MIYIFSKRFFFLILILFFCLFHLQAFNERPLSNSSSEYEGESGEQYNQQTVTENVEWGGSFQSVFLSEWGWNDYAFFTEFTDPDTVFFDADIKASLFFDARPVPYFRVYGHTDMYYPVRTTDVTDENPFSTIDMRIFELYTDFNWFERLYFRVGKQTINWGTGYFFSPVNLLNLSDIDYEKPEQPCEGPFAVKICVPMHIHSLDLYILAEDVTDISHLTIAPKLTLVCDPVIAGIGMVYEKNYVPYGMAVFSGSLLSGSLLNIDFFSEFLFSYGSNKTFIRETESSPYIETYRREDEAFLSFTAGISCILPQCNLEMVGQYYYNAEGYVDSRLLQNAFTAVDDNVEFEPQLTSDDLDYFGRHYCAVSITWSDSLLKNLCSSLFWLSNLSDGSGYFFPSFSYKLFNYSYITLGMKIFYGEEDDELLLSMQRVILCLEVSLGNGEF